MSYTYPQLQIGQAQMSPMPVVLGQGSLMVEAPITQQALVINTTTGDVIDVVLPNELILKRPTDHVYSIGCNKTVKKDDLLAVIIDGQLGGVFRVRQFAMWGGVVTVWDCFKEAA